MWLMLQQDKPKDYVIATGETYTVRHFVEEAFNVVDIDIVWRGTGISEIGVNSKTNETLVKISADYFRPAEVEILHGDPSLAERELGWARKVSFSELVREMVVYDLNNEGYRVNH